MNWIELNSEEQIEQIREESKKQPVLIFKHSTRCSISSTALSRLERNWKSEEVAPSKTYYLDLLSHRTISHHIAESFDVQHESPQVLIVSEGSPVYVQSHMGIRFDEIQKIIPAKK
jgi:bacillithiol system protein YtxJ